MSEWPSLGRVDDHRLAESLRAGDPDALAHIFDVYGARLFDYCHALLRDRAAAADALNDALIAVQAHVTKLRDAERFRGWLYAIARNECLRMLRGPGLNRPRQEAPEQVDLMLDAEARTMLQETRQLVHGALSGLNAQEREAVDLALRHDLEVEDLAGALALTGEQAAQLLEGARVELDNALAAAIVARTGRGDCPTVAALVDSWEGPISPLIRKKLTRHIDSCPTCHERRERKVATARLLQALPVAALPHDLRQRTLHSASAPELAAERAAIAQRAEPFDAWGWPSVLDRGRRAPQNADKTGKNRLWPAMAAAACVVLVVGMVFVFLPRGGSEGTGPPQAVPSPPVDPSSVEVSPSEEPTESPSTKATTSEPSTQPTTVAPPRRPQRRPTSSRPQPRPGTLTASGCPATLDENRQGECTITLTASGGPVSWSVAGSTGDNVTLGGGDRSLAAGQSTDVTATVRLRGGGQCAAGFETVSFSPRTTARVSWTCGD